MTVRGASSIVALAVAVAVTGLALARDQPACAAPPSTGEPPPAVFALIVGVNSSPGANKAALRYADDDAARTLDLFRALGARTYLLARLDAGTRALHPQAAAEASMPTVEQLRRNVETLAADIAQARARGVKSTLYIFYAGHGDVREAAWYLTLEDGALSESELLAGVVNRAGADQSHVIIDACHADLLAQPRGPGGTRRTLRGFVELEAASRSGRIGYLLSTSLSGETHEWTGFEAGVFSHAVRSGLYGAADADGDRLVTYPEIAAFVHRASESVVNQRYRPHLVARPPRDGDVLLDLRSRRDTELRFDGPERAAHYLLEDGQGVRVLDFHGSSTVPVHLVRPVGQGPLYLRRVADGAERTVPRSEGLVNLDTLPAVAPHAQPRGAAHDAFSKLFAWGFDAGAVEQWQRADGLASAAAERAARDEATAHTAAAWRRGGGWTAIGVGTAAAVAAVACEISAYGLRNAATPTDTHREVAERNGRIDARNHAALGLSVGAAVSLTAGTLLLLWPTRSTDAPDIDAPDIDVAMGPSSARLSARWRF